MRSKLAKVLTVAALIGGTLTMLPASPAGAAVVHVDCSTVGAIRILRGDGSRICIGGSGITGHIDGIYKFYSGNKSGVYYDAFQRRSWPFEPGQTITYPGGDGMAAIMYW